MTERTPPLAPDDPARIPSRSSEPDSVGGPGWEGPTYYGRSQLKAAPFNNVLVGGYIFLAGLSGAAALIAAVADCARREAAPSVVRRGRYLSLLATLGAPLLVMDLHTPKRFYNMLRVVKGASPMSIGSWTLVCFSGFAGLTAIAQFFADRFPRLRWLRRLGRATQVPTAAAGAGLSTYTASLLAATSTPLWAAAPQALAAQFGASSIAAGASALAMGERSRRTRQQLDALTVAALAAELAATGAAHARYRRTRIDGALESGWGAAERYGATALGQIVPLALHGLLSVTDRGRSGTLAGITRLAVLGGSLLLRISVLGAGDASAMRPDISLRFSQPENLPTRSRS